MKLSLIVRGQHPAGEDMRARLADDIDLVMRAEQLGFDALVKGSHYSAHPLQIAVADPVSGPGGDTGAKAAARLRPRAAAVAQAARRRRTASHYQSHVRRQ